MSVWRTSPVVTKTTKQIKRNRSDDVSDGPSNEASQPITLEALMEVMNTQFKLTFERIEEVKINITEKIDSVKTELDCKLDAVSRDIAGFKEECAAKFKANEGALLALDGRVDEISQEIDGIENRNELIVSGIPYLPEENLAVYFKTMWKHVGLDETYYPVIDIRRLISSRSGATKDGLILLQFALKNNRDDFYSSYLKKCDLQLTHLGINSSRRVYINENLSVTARKIKTAALRLKKAGKLSSVYTKLGTVFVKLPDDQQAVAVHSENQLLQFS